MKNVQVFIDGFNVYHSLNDKRSFHRYKWLDYRKLSTCYKQPDWTIASIFYFTSIPFWNPGKVARQSLYLEVLKDIGVEVQEGRFKEKTRRFSHDTPGTKLSVEWVAFEEKQTDVNIAVSLVAGACLESYDIALLISGDTDLCPAVRMVKKMYPQKEVHVILPFGRHADELKQVSDKSYKIHQQTLDTCILPEPYLHSSGRTIYRPQSWN
jgi:uncharacterized LabA/DUF88 family protein